MDWYDINILESNKFVTKLALFLCNQKPVDKVRKWNL